MLENKFTCEDCGWYEFIDSGYGYCRALPPKTTPQPKNKPWTVEYQVVPWTMRVCSFFKYHPKERI